MSIFRSDILFPMKLFLSLLVSVALFYSPVRVMAQQNPASPAPAGRTDTASRTVPAGKADTLARTVPAGKTDTAGKAAAANGVSEPPDDYGSPFALAFLLVFCAIVGGAAVAGACIVTVILLAIFGMVSAGVMSASILAGLYKRSIASGFTTLLLLVGGLGGIVAGAGGFWLINRMFHLKAAPLNAVLLGAASGLLGGLLCGFVISRLIKFFVEYFRRKLAFGV